MATKERSRKNIMFSELPLELKKQFLHHLTKNGVDFEQSVDAKYVQTTVKIIEEEEGEKKLVIPGAASRSKSKEKGGSKSRNSSERHFTKHTNHFHNKCVYSPWEQKRIENNSKLKDDLK